MVSFVMNKSAIHVNRKSYSCKNMLQLHQRNIYLRYSFCNNGLLFETCAVELDGTITT